MINLLYYCQNDTVQLLNYNSSVNFPSQESVIWVMATVRNYQVLNMSFHRAMSGDGLFGAYEPKSDKICWCQVNIRKIRFKLHNTAHQWDYVCAFGDKEAPKIL